MSNKQTAIDWFFRWLEDNQYPTIEEYVEAFKQAKAMEKEQIIEAYCDGFIKGSEGDRLLSEEYYNETYNK